jgi:hypothetical protein
MVSGIRLCIFTPQRTRTYLKCAVRRHGLPAGVKPARQLSLQPVVIGAVVEVTKRLKPSMQRVAEGDLTSWQAIT